MILSIPKERVARTTAAGGLAFLVAGLLIAGLSGCAAMHIPPPRTRTVGQLQPTNEPVVIGDEAIDLRQWPQSVAYYHSGTTQAFPTRWNYEGQETDSFAGNIIIEPTMFIVESATYPFRVVREPPGTKTNYADQVLPPTFNAMPPLPPEPTPPVDHYPHLTAFHAWLHAKLHGERDETSRPVPAGEPGQHDQTLAEQGKPFGAMRDVIRKALGIHPRHAAQPSAMPEPASTAPAPTATGTNATEPATTTSPAPTTPAAQ